MDALKILTLDCWREVLDRVKNPEDLKSCSETCLIFEDLLMSKMNLFLFDLILPKIMKYLPEVLEVVDEAGGLQPEEELDWKHLLKCRLVCQDWCKTIDKLGDTSSVVHPVESKYRFDSGRRTEEFLETFKDHRGNPIIGRNITIEHGTTMLMAQPPQENVQNEDVPQADIFHITKLRQLLSRFGNEIQTLKVTENVFRIEDRAIDMVEGPQDIRIENLHHLALCKNTQTMLSHTPNLRILRVHSIDRFMLGDQLDETDQELNELSAHIAANPLPPLPHLEGLAVPGLSLIMTRCMIEKYSSQLKILTISWHPARFVDEFPRFSCLKELNLLCLDPSTSLECLRELHSPLERLNLLVGLSRNGLNLWPIDELFRNIQHLPIRELEIINSSYVFLGESVPISSELRVLNESIRSVYIFFMGSPISLNLLAHCPNLEVLYIFHRFPPQWGFQTGHPNGVAELFDVTSLIQEEGFDMYQSNIWEGIPSLKKVTLGTEFGVTEEIRHRGTHYHRKTYEDRKREN